VPILWRIAGALLASIVVLASSFLLGGGRYQMGVGQAGAPMRLDRWTGDMMVCTTRLCVIYPTGRAQRFSPPPPASRPDIPDM
jgi:hypothetical protein